jgi:antitoxin component of MazEF toxin-antitoxin module
MQIVKLRKVGNATPVTLPAAIVLAAWLRTVTRKREAQ